MGCSFQTVQQEAEPGQRSREQQEQQEQQGSQTEQQEALLLIDLQDILHRITMKSKVLS